MLEDIKKILETVKKGVIIIEDGKPAYVLVPFQEYQEVMEQKKVRATASYQDAFKLGEKIDAQPIDDASMIQKIIDYELNRDAHAVSRTQEMEIQSLLGKLGTAQGEQEKGIEKDTQSNSLNLGDLPF